MWCCCNHHLQQNHCRNPAATETAIKWRKYTKIILELIYKANLCLRVFICFISSFRFLSSASYRHIWMWFRLTVLDFKLSSFGKSWFYFGFFFFSIRLFSFMFIINHWHDSKPINLTATLIAVYIAFDIQYIVVSGSNHWLLFHFSLLKGFFFPFDKLTNLVFDIDEK